MVDHAERLAHEAGEALLAHAAAIAGSACVVLLAEVELSVRHPLARAAGQVQVERFAARESAAAKPFALLEALGARDASAALQALHEQLIAGRDPLEVFGLVSWQVQRWLLVRRLLDRGYSLEGIASVAGLRAWQAQRLAAEVAQRPLERLQALLRACWRTEHEAKRGRAIPGQAVETLVLEACLAP